MATINFVLSTVSIWSLPSVTPISDKKWTRRLTEDIDWLGAVIMSVALGLLLYVLATLTTSLQDNQAASKYCSVGCFTDSASRLSCVDGLPD